MNGTNESMAGSMVTECRSINEALAKDFSTMVPVQVVFGVLYTLIVVLSVLGNSCVILAVSTNKQLQSVRNLFIVSLSCSDIAVATTSSTITPISAFAKNWPFGTLLCNLSYLVPGMSIFISTYTLTLIAVDRCILVVFPTRQPIQRHHAIGFIIAIWVMSMLAAAPAVYEVDVVSLPNLCGVFCFEDWGQENNNLRRLYGTSVTVLGFFVPLIIISACYTSIVIKLQRSMNNRSSGSLSSDRRLAAIKRRHRTNRMLICMVAIFAGCWLGQIMFNLLRDYDIMPSFTKDQQYFCGIALHCIAMTSTVWNPILYAYMNEQLREAFIALFPFLFKRLRLTAHKWGSLASLRSRQRRSATPTSTFAHFRRQSSFDFLRGPAMQLIQHADNRGSNSGGTEGDLTEDGVVNSAAPMVLPQNKNRNTQKKVKMDVEESAAPPGYETVVLVNGGREEGTVTELELLDSSSRSNSMGLEYENRFSRLVDGDSDCVKMNGIEEQMQKTSNDSSADVFL